MSAREFKPGDVAMVAHKTGEHRAIRVPDSWSLSTGWADCLTDDLVSEARPLVVIDPESAEDIDRLAALIMRLGYKLGSQGTLAMQANLREFANPRDPKPEEPTAMWSVVVDASDEHWVRVLGPDFMDGWVRAGDLPSNGKWTDYRNIAAVRVLSEGVS